jgi:tripartite-type tricarboxylate transporter receptor subunit TctC
MKPVCTTWEADMRAARRAIVVTAILALVQMAIPSGGASAQSYPTRPVTIVVPYPAGGPTDTLARIMSDRLKAALGQSVIIENITGAGGSIGVGHVARATPDGYTLALGHNQTHVINAATLKLNYDVVKDFEPVTLIADTPIWIIAKKTLPANDLKEFIAWLKASDGKSTAGTVGRGGPTDLAGTFFQKQTGTTFQFASYRGGAPLLQDLLAGHIDFAFGQASTYLPYVRNNQLKAYAVLMRKRWWAAPDVPTLDELGVPGTYATFWHGIWAPKDTPKPIIDKLNAAFKETLGDAAVQQRFKDVGQEMWPVSQQNPAALAAQQKAEIEKWWPIVAAAGMKPQ